MRELLFKENTMIELYEAFNVFADAVVEPISSIVQKIPPRDIDLFNVVLESRDKNQIDERLFSHEYVISKNKLIFNYRATEIENRVYEKIYLNTEKLNSFANVSAGIKPYEKGKGNPPQTKETLQEKPYTSYEKGDGWKPLIRGTQVTRYSLNWDGEYINYGEWLAAPRKKEIFFEPKLFIRRTDDKLLCVYDDKEYIGLNSIHCIQSFDESMDNKFLLCLINSKLVNWFFQHENFHMVGKPLAEVKVVFVERLPIIKIDPESQKAFTEKTDIMLDLNKTLQTKKQKFLKRITDNFEIEKLSKKLEAFYGHDFKTFLAELKKKKITLTLTQQDEWEEYFQSYKTELTTLQTQIDSTDREIDTMVYALYGLNEEEIAVVEGEE